MLLVTMKYLSFFCSQTWVRKKLLFQTGTHHHLAIHHPSYPCSFIIVIVQNQIVWFLQGEHSKTDMRGYKPFLQALFFVKAIFENVWLKWKGVSFKRGISSQKEPKTSNWIECFSEMPSSTPALGISNSAVAALNLTSTWACTIEEIQNIAGINFKKLDS